MNCFSKSILFLAMISSCSYQKKFDKRTDGKYNAMRQNLRDSLTKGIIQVNDFYGIYSPVQKSTIDSKITAFTNRTDLRIVIVTMDSTMASSDSIEIITQIIGMKNKIGTTISISPDLKKMFIWNDSLVNNTVLKQNEAKEIIDEKFVPAFRTGDYYRGTLEGLEAIIETIEEKLRVKF